MTPIAGYDSPPVRHIVGWELIASVKEKKKKKKKKVRTVSKELEDFAQTSSAIDIPAD